jgi:hypothetical protein
MKPAEEWAKEQYERLCDERSKDEPMLARTDAAIQADAIRHCRKLAERYPFDIFSKANICRTFSKEANRIEGK